MRHIRRSILNMLILRVPMSIRGSLGGMDIEIWYRRDLVGR